MITKADAVAAKHGQTFYHVSLLNSDKTPVRCRVSGMCKTWVRRPSKFRLPVKYGLYQSFYINESNAVE